MSTKSTVNKHQLGLIALFLLLIGLGLRLYDLDDQPIDFHPTRQLRGAIIARGMYYQMSSSFDDASRAQALAFWESTGQYEPPILERAVALGYLLLHKEIPWLARLFNSVAWMLGGAAVFDLARQIRSKSQDTWQDEGKSFSIEISAAIVLAYYLVLPFSVQASRSFQPDPGMVVWLILAVWAAFRWSEKTNWIWALVTGVFSGLAIITKAIAAYTIAGLLISLVIYTFRKHKKISWLKTISSALSSAQVWTMLILSLAPTVLYYSGRGARTSEFIGSWTLSLSTLLLRPETYLRWLNLVQGLLSPIALLLSLIGIFLASGRSKAMLMGLLVGYFAYGLFLPYQMTTHSYYHLQLIPIIALCLTPVLQDIFYWVRGRSNIDQAAVYLCLAFLLVYSSWQALIPLYSRDYRIEPEYWSNIASRLPEEGKIIALTQDYGYRLMYYGWRKVVLWPNRGEIKLSVLRGSEKDFQDFFTKRIEGKRYFLITAFNQFESQPELQRVLNERFSLHAEGNGYLIYDLLQQMKENSPQGSEGGSS